MSSKRLRIRVQSVKKLQKIERSDSEEPFAKNNVAMLPHEVYQQQTDQKAAEKTRKQSERRANISRRSRSIPEQPKLEKSSSLNYDDDRTETEDDGISEIPSRSKEQRLQNPEESDCRKRGYFFNAKSG